MLKISSTNKSKQLPLPKRRCTTKSAPVVARSTANSLDREILRIETLCAAKRKQNSHNQRVLNYLNDLSLKNRAFLLQDFEEELNSYGQSLESRHTRLVSLEKLLHSFSQKPSELLEEGDERAKLQSRNKHLTDIALANEREILLMKMRLRLFHDHRDLCALRKNLRILSGIEELPLDETKRTQNNKLAVTNLRRQIYHEKQRIESLTHKDYWKHQAARTIQAFWRGVLYRQHSQKS